MPSKEKEHWKHLTRASTVELARLIVRDSDAPALRCFVETRALFGVKDSSRKLLLIDYLDRLRGRKNYSRTIDIRESNIRDCAYDLTLEKYLNLNAEKGPDCRNYYGAFLKIMQRKIDEGIYSTKIEEESDAGRIFQKLVNVNFYRSRLECIRKIKLTKRYRWNTGKGEIPIEYPAYLTGREIRKWLTENIKDVNPTDANEQKRIQGIIEANLQPVRHVRLDNPTSRTVLSSESDIRLFGWKTSMGFITDLASSVAKRKVENIEHLRPAIRKLGGRIIKSLIFRIFDDLSEDDFHEAKIAKEFGISKATFSRFAGSQWRKEDMESTTVPDLWRNTAVVMAQSDAFLDKVVESGFKVGLERILNSVKPIHQKDLHNG